MVDTKSNAYKNQRREIAKTLTRQGLFISEYVQFKHKEIYRQACIMYNQLNSKYPRKPDLRKAKEFRIWKNTMANANGDSPVPVPRGKEYVYKRTTYWNIMLDDDAAKATTEKQTPSATSQKDMCLNIPLIGAPTLKKSLATALEEGQQIPLMAQGTVIDQGYQIPLPPIQSPIEQDINPSLIDEISPEDMEKIIRELEADPQLSQIMEDVQQNVSVTQYVDLDLTHQISDVELPDLDDLLSEEMELW